MHHLYHKIYSMLNNNKYQRFLYRGYKNGGNFYIKLIDFSYYKKINHIYFTNDNEKCY